MKDREYTCPVDAALGLIGGKYKTILLYHLREGKMRFSELQRTVPTATAKMLTQQLRELETDGIIKRKVYPVVPPKTEYELTKFGKTLVPVLEAICEWSKEYVWDNVEHRS